MIKNDPTNRTPYPIRIVVSVIILLVGAVFLASSLQYMLLQQQMPQSIHEMKSEELEGAYVTINRMLVIRKNEHGYYVQVPISNDEMMDMAFYSDDETINHISSLKGAKNLEIFKDPNGGMVSSSDYFISLDYTGTIYKGEQINIFKESGISTFLGIITKNSSNRNLLIGATLSIYGIFVLVSTIIIIRRKPKIVNSYNLQLTYSEYQLEEILISM